MIAKQMLYIAMFIQKQQIPQVLPELFCINHKILQNNYTLKRFGELFCNNFGQNGSELTAVWIGLLTFDSELD